MKQAATVATESRKAQCAQAVHPPNVDAVARLTAQNDRPLVAGRTAGRLATPDSVAPKSDECLIGQCVEQHVVGLNLDPTLSG